MQFSGVRRLGTQLSGPHRAKVAGFAAGIVGTLVVVLLLQAVVTGRGLWEPPSASAQVYPNF